MNNASIEKEFRYIRDIKEIPMADFSNAVAQEPFKTQFSIPGAIQAEDYDMGGQSVSFYDKDFVNEGGVYREDGVDVVGLGCADSAATVDCNGYAIGYTAAGEWVEYSVDVILASKYVFRANVANGLEGGSIQLFLDGKAITDTIPVPQGEDWNTYGFVEGETAEIEKGDHVLRILFTDSYVNLDWIQFALTKEEHAGIRGVAYNVNFMPSAGRTLKMYGADGKFLGSVEKRAPPSPKCSGSRALQAASTLCAAIIPGRSACR